MNELEAILVAGIKERGPMPFASYMQLALYHPTHGYYSSGPRTGFAGHFVTAAEIGPAFGALWARGFAQIWDGCGRPERFDVVEIGPGEAGAARAILAAAQGAFGQALRYHLVERNRATERRQRAALQEWPSVQWHPAIDAVPPFSDGCVFANEVLDNLPVHIVEQRDGRILEVCVEETDGRLALGLRPPSTDHLESYLRRAGIGLVDGSRYEVGLAAVSLINRAATLFDKGALILVDYGITASDAASRPAGTLVCYSEAGVDAEPLSRPGEKDITTHANWTVVLGALVDAGLITAGPVAQAAALKALGLAEYDDILRAAHDRAATAGEGAAAVRALSRRQGLRVLTDPAGLGAQDVVAGLRGLEVPGFLRGDQRGQLSAG